MAVGVESGRISLFSWPTGQPSGCALLHAFPDKYVVVSAPRQLIRGSLSHTGTVHRLAFCPRDSEVLRLASAGEDRAVRILDVQL